MLSGNHFAAVTTLICTLFLLVFINKCLSLPVRFIMTVERRTNGLSEWWNERFRDGLVLVRGKSMKPSPFDDLVCSNFTFSCWTWKFCAHSKCGENSAVLIIQSALFFEPFRAVHFKLKTHHTILLYKYVEEKEERMM